MKLVDLSIKKPVTVSVGAILLLLFGFLALLRIPIQLTPNVDLPEVSIQTTWAGASPEEVEREITDVQEKELKSLNGLTEIKSESQDGLSVISLEFEIGTDIDQALLRVSNKMEQVKSYPDNVDRPIIKSGGRFEKAIAWMVLIAEEGYRGNLEEEYDFIDEEVQPRLERLPGVSSVDIHGGKKRELQVVVDVGAMASRGITIPDLIHALNVENRTISAGDFDDGKRRYIARTVGEYQSPEEAADVIIRRVSGIPVAVKDVATVRLGHETPDVVVRQDGVTTIVMSAVREPGTNVLLVMDRLKAALAELNAGILKDRHLSIRQVYDETTYIYDAISLVKKNLMIGSVLAVIVLLLFLRNIAGTVVVSAAIPISVVGTFLFMTLAGRNINVVSLAGLSFAVGMVVDNSIVVFENIFRHREMGKDRIQAAFDGTTEVWGAVLASTLTTVAVFLPIVFVEEEAGQLFRDIAIAISSAVALSLLVSITGIPTLCALILGRVEKKTRPTPKRGFSVNRAAGGFVSALAGFVDWMCGRVWSRVAVIVALVGLAVVLVVNLIPQTEYLPAGDREMLFGILIPPPGYNSGEFTAIARAVEADILPLVSRNGTSEAAEKLNLPTVKNFFYVAFLQQVFMGVVSREAPRAAELIPYIYQSLGKVPGMIPIVYQAGLFTRGLGSGRSIDVDIKGPDLARLIDLGRQIYGMTAAAMPGAQIRPIPGLDLGNPELRITPNRDRLTRLGISTTDLGTTVDALVDGATAGTYRIHGDEIDLVVKVREDRLKHIQDLEAFPVVSSLGGKVLLGSVADVRLTEGPAQINHIDTQRAITIQVNPPADISLERAMEIIAQQVIAPVKARAQPGSLYRIDMGGTADQLTRTREALIWNLVLAVAICYLLMSALFESFLYPLIILFSVPLAAAGGLLGIFLVNRFVAPQPLDILTMLGFVILVGIVVNNAILIVHQSLNNIRRHAMVARRAITESVRSRIRPIYMSSITTVFGMLPLVLFPGAGSEFYRGLGGVVVGGLLISTIFTIFLIPAILSLTMDTMAAMRRLFKRTETHR
jgi:HAE1 family hydrophobic/amphiphilic exporter-1